MHWPKQSEDRKGGAPGGLYPAKCKAPEALILREGAFLGDLVRVAGISAQVKVKMSRTFAFFLGGGGVIYESPTDSAWIS